jgi:hypothetical protein
MNDIYEFKCLFTDTTMKIMVQCEEYPQSCEGSVMRSLKDMKWLCKKHYYTLDHLRSIGEK